MVYRARAWSGQPVAAPDEVHGLHWCTPAQLQHLADRTIAYVRGRLAEEDWQACPGMEPVWVYMAEMLDRKSTRLNSSHVAISYAAFCLKKKKNETDKERQARDI